MNEVNEFISQNPGVGAELIEFAKQYQTLADVWQHCPRSHWMLRILRIRKYRNAENLERYIDWLSDRIEDVNEAQLEETRRRHFSYKGYVKQLEEEVSAGKMTQLEARRRRFIGALITAELATAYVLNDTFAKAQFNNLFMKIVSAQDGEDLSLPEVDEIELKLAELRKQADKLREIIGNPFTGAGVDDFYYGRGIG